MKVQKECCGKCLFSKNMVVKNNARRKEIIQGALMNDTYFQCHEGTLSGVDVCCRAFWDNFKDRFNLGRIVQRLGGPEFVAVKYSHQHADSTEE